MLKTSQKPFKSLFSILKANYSARQSPMQKIIMLCGAPGVGKGTYSRLLAEDFGYVKISPGDEIRKILNSKTNTNGLSSAVLSELRTSVEAGKLVPDQIIMELLHYQINDPRASRGIILDGFPRTVNQLKIFNQMCPLHLIINIQHNIEYLLASILGRRTCMNCGMSYSAYSYYKDGYELDIQMPMSEKICDHCGGEVKIRDDDKEEVLRERLLEYEQKTFPLLQNAEHEGNLVNFNAKRGIRDYPKLQQIIVSRVGLPYFYNQYMNLDYANISNFLSYYN